MLSCQECERYLPVFLDHALEVKESLDVQAHLQSCLACHDRAASERRCVCLYGSSSMCLLPQRRSNGPLSCSAMQDERRCWWRTYLPVPGRLRDFAMGMATAAILSLVVYGILPDLWSDRDIQKVVHEASLAYGTHVEQHMPLEVVSADDTKVTQWLNTHMGNHIKMPCITDTATQLLGGRVCRILDRKSAALVYQRRGVPIMLFAFHGDHMSLPSQQNASVRLRTSCRHVATQWCGLFHGRRHA